jgi:flagellar basal-body rod protein FlgG
VFEDLMYQNLRQAGAASSDQTQLPTGLQVGLGVRSVATSRNFSQGSLQQTSNNLDLAINGNGFLQVQMPDGTTGYTRDGSLQVNATGQLVTNNGYVVHPGITIPATAQNVTIAPDGTVSVTLPNQTATQTIGQLQLAGFVNPAGLEPKGQNLWAETAASGAANAGAPGSNGLGSLQQGYVETSNVNVVTELVSMIATQRAYELNSKAIQTSDQMLQKLGQL